MAVLVRTILPIVRYIADLATELFDMILGPIVEHSDQPWNFRRILQKNDSARVLRFVCKVFDKQLTAAYLSTGIWQETRQTQAARLSVVNMADFEVNNLTRLVILWRRRLQYSRAFHESKDSPFGDPDELSQLYQSVLDRVIHNLTQLDIVHINSTEECLDVKRPGFPAQDIL